MPSITFRGRERPKVGQHIIVRIAFGTTIGAVWKIVTLTGEIIAKARVRRDLSRENNYRARLFRDPRRDDDNPGSDESNLADHMFDLEVEVTSDDEVLY